MSLQNLHSKVVRKPRKRVGRGNGSGHGTFSTRGCKGQKARSGGNIRPGFEGGQTPFMRRLPKLKGFKSLNHKEYQCVNTGQLNVFEDNFEVNAEALFNKKLIAKKDRPVKLLGGKGDLEKTLNVTVHKASKSAIAKIESKKGKVTLLIKEIAPTAKA